MSKLKKNKEYTQTTFSLGETIVSDNISQQEINLLKENGCGDNIIPVSEYLEAQSEPSLLHKQANSLNVRNDQNQPQ